MIKTVAVHNIPKFLEYNNLYSYAKAITLFVSNNTLQNLLYQDKEVTEIFLSHLDDEKYSSAIKECRAALLLSNTVDDIYLVPAIAGTIAQLRGPINATTNQHRERTKRTHPCPRGVYQQ